MDKVSLHYFSLIHLFSSPVLIDRAVRSPGIVIKIYIFISLSYKTELTAAVSLYLHAFSTPFQQVLQQVSLYVETLNRQAFTNYRHTISTKYEKF